MVNLNYENTRLLDVVNKKDEVVSSKSRIEIHRLGLLHREVHVFMFDKDKNVFFQKKGLHTPVAGLLHATVAGHVNKGEKYLKAAIRETKEETGIKIKSSDLILMEKFMVSNLSPSPMGRPVNNFIRSVYIYKKPIKEENLQKEKGIQGGGFRKFSYEFLLKSSKEDWKEFHHSMPEELPKVLSYLKKWTN